MDSEIRAQRKNSKKKQLDDLAVWRWRAVHLNGFGVIEHMRQLEQAARDKAAKTLQDEQDKKDLASYKKTMAECKKTMNYMLVEVGKMVGKIDKEQRLKEKEERRVQDLKAAPQQRVTQKIRKMLTERCYVCSKLCSDCSPTQQSQWVGCLYCDFKWQCHDCLHPVHMKAHEDVCKS
jgi:hypothetical protein